MAQEKNYDSQNDNMSLNYDYLLDTIIVEFAEYDISGSSQK